MYRNSGRGGPAASGRTRTGTSTGTGTARDEPGPDLFGPSPARPGSAIPRRRPAGLGLGEALLLTALSVVMPGLAHLRAGRTRAGGVLLTAYALGLAALGVAAGHARTLVPELVVRPAWLAALIAGCAVAAAAWTLLIVRSYALLRPVRASLRSRAAGGVAVAVLCALAAVPPLAVAHYGHLQKDLLDSVFTEAPELPEPAPAGTSRPVAAAPVPRPADPFQRTGRLDVLLLGADADTGRPGVRTDSMTLASIDTRTGDTVLLSLPRNLQRVPVWSGRRPVRFPARELLNAVYQHGIAHPGALDGPRVRNPGAELLKRTAGHILGRPVPYYVMVDMRSFRQIVDAMGGVRICVDRAVPVPKQQVPAGVLRPGCRELTGREALWYGRSRTGASDYARMGRQKCLMWAIAEQADPLAVLRGFQRLSAVFRNSVSTDLPRGLLPGLVALSGKIKNAQVTSLQFVPPLVSTGSPDYPAIRRLAARAVAGRASGGPERGRLLTLNKSCT
ncbi:LCP family protein [Actinomadura hibisca]|uniref:LCP family protein n=1 Tax=Actinomadura hibisca TaxID=68565 RepID=UPI0008316152|nr:LCP family protein [Actinomadura hibisca]